MLAFLPADNEAVKTFDRINERFGGLNVALVGIPIDDPLDPTFGKLQSLPKASTPNRRLQRPWFEQRRGLRQNPIKAEWK